MKIECTEKFKKDFLKLPPNIRKTAAKQVTQLLIDHSNPSLHIEGIEGRKGVYSVRIDNRYRMSIQFADKSTLLLRRIQSHDDLYKKP